MAGSNYINYGVFESRAGELKGINDDLRTKLNDIQKVIKNIETSYRSNASDAIRAKMDGMTPRFDQYQEVVEKYVNFIKKTGADWKAADDAVKKNADQFV